MTIKNMLNAEQYPKNYEVFTMPSMTIPDQTLSIKEILQRFARGLPIDGAKVPIYEGEDYDLPDPRRLDLAERQEMAENYAKEIKQIHTLHQQQQAAYAAKNSLKNDSSEKPQSNTPTT